MVPPRQLSGPSEEKLIFIVIAATAAPGSVSVTDLFPVIKASVNTVQTAAHSNAETAH